MGKVLIMTLGTGENVEHGLAKSIQALNPESIYCLGSPRSSDLLERLKKVLPEYRSHFMDLRLLKDENDFDSCTEEVRELISDLVDDGVPLRDIDIDFTSGTKAMSAGLANMAALFGIGRMSYVTGQRDKKTGKVISGNEKIVIVFPTMSGIAVKRGQLAVFFNANLFEAGNSLADSILSSCSHPLVEEELLNWKRLFELYGNWDRFNHTEANHLIKILPPGFIKKLKIDIAANKEMLNRIVCKKSLNTDRILETRFFPELLADLVANADRRAKAGRLDDAVARLYRAAEMTAQIGLAEKGIDTSCLKCEQIPQSIRTDFPEIKSDGKAVSVGLDRSFKLLRALGELRADEYLKNSKIKQLLSSRNASILV